MLNRRETLGALGGLALGFLFRGRGGKLQDKPVRKAQKPSVLTITTTPQVEFLVERLIVPITIAPLFVIESIRIDTEEQLAKFAQDDSIMPPELYTANEQQRPPLLPVTRGIQFRVRYIGDKPEGERFIASLIGTTPGRPGKMVLPIDSGTSLVS